MTEEATPAEEIKIHGYAFHPDDSHHRWKLWARSNEPGQPLKIHIFWSRLIFAAMLTPVLGWMFAALVVFFVIREKHEFKEIEYTNIVFPSRWPEHRKALGRYYIRRADKAYDDEKYGDALQYYVQGAIRVPEDYNARLRLGEMLVAFGNPPAAIQFLTNNLDTELADPHYLQVTFSLLFEYNREEQVLLLTANEQNITGPAPDQRHQYLAFQAAKAYFHRGDYDACERQLRQRALDDMREGIVLLAQCDWERGYPQLAISRLKVAQEKFPVAPEISFQLVRLYRELGQYDLAYNESLLRLAADPVAFGPRIDLIHVLQLKGQLSRVDEEIDLYIMDFSTKKEAMWLLASFARDYGQDDLLRKLIELSRDSGRQVESYQIAEIQACLTAGHYAEAQRLAERMLATYPQDTFIGGFVVGLRAVACYGLGDTTNGEVYLQAFLTRVRLPSSDAIFIFEKLEKLEALRAARSVLAKLVKREPYNQTALTRLIQYDATHDNIASLEENLPQLLKLSKPSRRVLQDAYVKLNDATPERAALRSSVAAAVARLTDTPAPN